MPTVQIPHEFFRKERDQFYYDWMMAIWRELLQNSIDAGATVLSVSISGTEKEPVIEFSDDGTGMDRKTLEEVFFRLGATTKKNDGISVGGFGRARLLTCFAQREYTIETKNIVVSGSGADYEIKETEDNAEVEGCTFKIAADGTASELERALRRLMETCSPDISIDFNRYVEGVENVEETISGKLTAGRTKKVMRDENGKPFAKICTTAEKTDSPVVIIRCLGLSTSRRFVGGLDSTYIVEIDPSRVREVLLGNRDGFRPPFDSMFNDFIQKLSQNRRAALKEEKTEFVSYLDESSSTKMFTTRSFQNALENERALDSGRKQSDPEANEEEEKTVSIEAADPLAGIAKHRPEEAQQTVAQDVFPHAVYAFFENPTRKLKSKARDFLPENWNHAHGRNSRLLLTAWRVCVEASLEALIKEVPSIGEINWGVGWLFTDDTTEAVCKKTESGHHFLLSPIDKDGNKKYRIKERDDILKLMAFAQHEATHVVCGEHDENFASMLTAGIAAKFDQKTVFARIAYEMAAVPMQRKEKERKRAQKPAQDDAKAPDPKVAAAKEIEIETPKISKQTFVPSAAQSAAEEMLFARPRAF